MGKTLSKGLSKLVVTVALPALTLSSVMGGQPKSSGQLLQMLFVAVACYALLIIMALLFPRILKTSPEKRGTYGFMLLFGNVGFIGFPVVAALWGKQAVFIASMINLPFNFLVFTLGIWLLSGNRGEGLPVKQCFNTGTIASLIALLIALFQIPVTPVIANTCSQLGQITTPAVLLIIGSTLADIPAKELLGSGRTYVICLLRLLVVPLVIWLALKPFVNNSMLLGVTVILSGLPVASNGMMLCLEYDGDVQTMGQATFVTTVLSVITIPIITTIL